MEDYKQLEQEYEKLKNWTEELQKGKDFLESENKKLVSWCEILEKDKKELLEKLERQVEKTEDAEIKLAAAENEKSKINYKLNLVLADAKIKKIVESKKIIQF